MTPPPAQSQLKPLSECKDFLEGRFAFSTEPTLYQSILAHIDALEKREAAAKETLRFYADPPDKDECGDDIRHPDFYDELDFGNKARDTLRMMVEGK